MLIFDAGTFMLISTPNRPNVCLDFIFDTDVSLDFIWDDC